MSPILLFSFQKQSTVLLKKEESRFRKLKVYFVLFICLSKCLLMTHYLSCWLPSCCFGFYFDFWVFRVRDEGTNS